jgi:pimeloyl-ACP methyl ester carboxylesterase
MDLEPPSRTLSCIVQGVHLTVPLWEKGQGRCLLMLHGWGLDHASFYPLREQLAPSFRVLTLDLPGFGQAMMPSQLASTTGARGASEGLGWGIPEYTQLVAALIQQLDVQEPVIVLGHSFGGRIGMRLAASHPELVAELILVASAGLRRPAPFLKRAQLKVLRLLGKCAQQLLPAFMAEPLRHALIQRTASRDYLAAGPLRSTLVRVVNENAATYAGSIQAPTLLIWGEKDQDTPPWIGRVLGELIPNASLCMLPDLDHHTILTAGRFQVAYQIRQHLQNPQSAGCRTDHVPSLRQAQAHRTTFSS